MRIAITFRENELKVLPQEIQERLNVPVDYKDDVLNSAIKWDVENKHLSAAVDTRVAEFFCEYMGTVMPMIIMATERLFDKLKALKEKIKVEKELSEI